MVAASTNPAAVAMASPQGVGQPAPALSVLGSPLSANPWSAPIPLQGATSTQGSSVVSLDSNIAAFPLPPLPRYSSVNGGVQASEPQTPPPIPTAPAEPFPNEPGDVPVPAQPEPQPLPAIPPEPPAAASPYMPIEDQLEDLLNDMRSLTNERFRYQLAFHAVLLSVSPTLNYLSAALRRLDPKDWNLLGTDLLETMARQASDLADQLAELQKKLGGPEAVI